MDELIRVQDRHYILASSSRIDDRTRVLKDGDTFAVLDRFGEIAPIGMGELGLYRDGTRFLSRLSMTVNGNRPLLLGSNVSRDNTHLVVDLTNPDLPQEGGAVIPRGTLHLQRELLLWKGVCYGRLRIVHHGSSVLPISVKLTVEADFVDIFEVRGTPRAHTGTRHPPRWKDGDLVFVYDGLDGVRRTASVQHSETPTEATTEGSCFALELVPHQAWRLDTVYACSLGDAPVSVEAFDTAADRVGSSAAAARRGDCEIETSNDLFNSWLERSIADLHQMIVATPYGPYPHAGIPWFCTPFGRDGILTALEILWMNPSIAEGVLSYLAAFQADHADPSRDAQPGKILHEARGGEMAALGEVPFGRYYGSVDSTPLFVFLAGATFRRTGDAALVKRLMPHIERALAWMETDGDPDGDGFLEYARESKHGLVQQGWKDSFDSVFYSDGELARAPIALCEVQGYAYAAYRAAADLIESLQLDGDAAKWRDRAERVQRRFEEEFWCEDMGTYALALDGEKKPCRVRSSNAGQALFTGIVREDRAVRLAQTLLAEDSFSGWGIRTLSSREARYNPMSYHNGSVWPHDNALIAMGFARYRLHYAAVRILTALFEASQHFDLRRTPELYCGFPRERDAGPILYPVACSPQAWAAGSPFLLLASCLGLSIDGAAHQVTFDNPTLPPFLDLVFLRNLRVGEGTLDLRIDRYDYGIDVSVLRRQGGANVVLLRR